MNILFITHHYLTTVGGASFASRAYINAFAAISDEMTLLYPVKQGQNVFMEIDKKIKQVPVANNMSFIKRAFYWLLGRTHRYDAIAPSIIQDNHFDYVVFDNSKTSFRLLEIAKKKGCKTIVINHNFEFEYIRDNYKGIVKSVNLFWIKKVESNSAQKADLNLTLSKQDIKLICDAYRNGNQDNFKLLGTFEYAPHAKARFANLHSSRNRFVITGNLSAVQTIDSLVPWLRNYYPILKKIYPDSELTIAGLNPGLLLSNMCKELGISLIASPKSMDPIMANADFYICPTSLGGGIKLRVMDGLRWGLPVVTHKVSARGYDLFVKKGCMFTYSDEISFQNALLSLKRNTFNKEQVYNTYRNIFSFEAGVERLRNILAELS